MNPIISLHNVGVKYKIRGSIFRKKLYFEALKSIDLDIYKGETLGILGQNGAGKSTLLRVISGVIKPDSGMVINRGVSVSLLSLQVGFDPNLNGRDNAILSGMLQGYSRQEVKRKLGEIKEYSELEGFFEEPIRTYSTGMKSRLGFSIGISVGPQVLLLDEILSVGDTQFKEKATRTMLGKIESSQTVVIVSHSLQLVAKLCDRSIVIKDGHSFPTS